MGTPRQYRIDSDELRRHAPLQPAGDARRADRARDAWLRLRLLRLGSRGRSILVAALVAVGVAALLNAAMAPAEKAASAGFEPQDVSIRGRVVMPGLHTAQARDSAMSGVRLRFSFPEIPLDVEKRLADVATSGEGEFEVRFAWKSRRPTHYFSLVVQRPGYQEARCPRLFLTGDPPACIVAPVRLQREDEETVRI